MVLYNEGSASEANFNTELVLASVLKSVDIAALTHDNFFGQKSFCYGSEIQAIEVIAFSNQFLNQG